MFKKSGISRIFHQGQIVLVVLVFLFCREALAAAPVNMPTPETPLLIDRQERSIFLYTEVSKKHLSETTPHWGIVYKDGKLADEAIFRSFASPEAFYDALVAIGARPGNNLTLDSSGVKVKGDRLAVTAVWPEQKRELPLSEIISDATGRGFDIRFGGNRERASKEKTGCILCLESCPIAITSNAAYPTISGLKRFFAPNSHFKGRSDVLPGVDKAPVIFIFRIPSP